ncbi:MAG: hypothetical protein LBJ63_11410 [Prevotellaceae bacterium]|jgi:hypothetical protein|nr:hypothetical protein [Prevotellaceae bacterium]
MKKLIYLLALAVLIAACGKDDVSINPKAIVGNWESTYYYCDIEPKEPGFTDFDFFNYDKYSYIEESTYLTFLADTACGMIYENKYIYSYEVNNGVIKKTRTCENNYSHPITPLFPNFHWRIVNNKLIRAYSTGAAVYYYVYVRL